MCKKINIHLYFFFQTLIVQVKCFEEIINILDTLYIESMVYHSDLYHSFLITSNYFFYGGNLMDYFAVVINRTVSVNSSDLNRPRQPNDCKLLATCHKYKFIVVSNATEGVSSFQYVIASNSININIITAGSQ